MAAPSVREDERELLRMGAAYALAVDERDDDALASLFVPDGRVVIYRLGDERPIAVMHGEALRGLTGILEETYVRTMHVVTNHLVHVDGDVATGAAYCVAHHYLDDGERSEDQQLFVAYRDRCVRTAGGWRFAEREIRRQWTAVHPAGQWPLDVDRRAAERAAR